MTFIDEHRLLFGVEPICRVLRSAGLPIAPSASSYYAAKTRPASARAVAGVGPSAQPSASLASP